jgi:hypothetical protein
MLQSWPDDNEIRGSYGTRVESSPEWTQSSQTLIPYFPKIRFNIFFYTCLSAHNDIFPRGFLTNILHAFLFCPMHATYP